MVNPNSLYIGFVQCLNCNSCTLASYAVASYHFIGLGAYYFFLDYCKHFKIPASFGQDAERKYAEHFHEQWTSRKCSGYKIIEELHNNSMEPAFVTSRARFGVQYIHQAVSHLQQIENRLKDEEVLISVAFKVNRNVHSCCVGFDGQRFYMIETSPSAGKTGIVPIRDIQSLGSLQDSLLMSPNPINTTSSGGNYGLQ